MPRIWRWVTPISVAGLLTAGVALPAQAAPSAYNVTISATSPNYPGASHGKVDGDALVVYGTKPSVYHWKKNWSIATISGTVSGATAGDVATLFAAPFGADSFTSTGQTSTLAATGSDNYSFTVKPALATRYEVQVATGATLDSTSAAQTVYSSLAPIPYKLKTRCSGGHCKITGKLRVLVPSGALTTESHKRWFFYFEVVYPKFSKYFPLDRAASASKATKLNPGEFQISITIPFSSHLRNPAPYAVFTQCTKDEVTKDGIGLPGHHGCGAAKINIYAPYLG